MEVKLRAGDYYYPVDLVTEGKHLSFAFTYNPALVDEIKTLDLVGSGWQGYANPPRKVWLAHNSARTKFRLDAMMRDRPNPYARYDSPVPKLTLTDRPYFPHQVEGVSFIVHVRQCILAWEMGTMKTLIAMRAMEWARDNLGWADEDFWWVAPKGALAETEAALEEWKCRVKPKLLTYDAVKELVARWQSGKAAPKFVVFDESTKLKSCTSQRWKAAMHLTAAMRQEHRDPFIVLMSGSPAPKNPIDWWPQAEVACPGFIREGSIKKFEARLAIVDLVENHETGGRFPKFIAWLDDERKCAKCGKMEPDAAHSEGAILANVGHPWKKSVNEVGRLYSRFKGFVSVKFKKDVLDLPPKVHKVIRCKPTQQVLNAAKLITKRAQSAVQAMILLRELSDGFQYRDEVIGQQVCPSCDGSGQVVQMIDPDCLDGPTSEAAIQESRLVERLGACDRCSGAGQVDVTRREPARIPCPKDDALVEVIEEHEDAGRLVTYAGFTGSVDRIVEVYLRVGWHVVRVDGRGWAGFAPAGTRPLVGGSKELYRTFRFGQADYPKVAFVAQASSAGHGLNLTASPTEVFYSNDFNFESRIQAEERNNRMGVQAVLGRTGRTSILVIDLVHLATDQKVLDNHKVKRTLQAMTMGEVAQSLEAA